MTTPPTWWSEGYTPQYKFVYSGLDGDDRLYDVTDVPAQYFHPDQPWSFTGSAQDLVTGVIPGVKVYDPYNPDPQYQSDHARWLQAATGQPGSGWAVEGDHFSL